MEKKVLMSEEEYEYSKSFATAFNNIIDLFKVDENLNITVNKRELIATILTQYLSEQGYDKIERLHGSGKIVKLIAKKTKSVTTVYGSEGTPAYKTLPKTLEVPMYDIEVKLID